MHKSLRTWLGQVTTGGGFMVLAPTLLSVFSGALTWAGAVPLLVGGLVGIFWPENVALKTASQTVAADVTSMVGVLLNKTGAPGPVALAPAALTPMASMSTQLTPMASMSTQKPAV